VQGLLILTVCAFYAGSVYTLSLVLFHNSVRTATAAGTNACRHSSVLSQSHIMISILYLSVYYTAVPLL